MNTNAQVKNNTIFNWEKAIKLPNKDEHNSSLGFAGMIGGVCQNIMIAAGGANFPQEMPWDGGIKKYYDNVFIYTKKNNSFQLLDSNNKLPFPIAYAGSCTVNNQIVVVGGENEQGVRKEAFVIKLVNGAFQFIALPDLPIGVTNAMVTFKDNYIYVLGGESNNKTVNQFICIDLNNPVSGWKQLCKLPYSVSNAVVSMHNVNGLACLYVLGGRSKQTNGISAIYDDIIKYNFIDDTWSYVRKLPYPLAAGIGFAISDHETVLLGGDKGIVFNQVETLIQKINTTTSSHLKEELIQQKKQIQLTHPGFSRDVILYDVFKNSISIIGKTDEAIPVTTAGVKFDNKFYVFSGELKAGIRSAYIYSFTLIHNNE